MWLSRVKCVACSEARLEMARKSDEGRTRRDRARMDENVNGVDMGGIVGYCEQFFY